MRSSTPDAVEIMQKRYGQRSTSRYKPKRRGAVSTRNVISFSASSVLGHASAQQAEARLSEFVNEHRINYCSHIKCILKEKTPEQVFEIIKEFSEPLFITEDDDLWLGENFIFEYACNHMKNLIEVHFTIYCNLPKIKEIEEELKATFSDFAAELGGVVRCSVNWHYKNAGKLETYSLTEVISEKIHNEAYPILGDVDTFIDGYFNSTSPIMILTGSPGTGKSRLIRYMVMRHGLKYDDSPEVIFTSDMKVITEEEGFFIHFRVGEADFMVLEDIDTLLQPRKDGNDVMHKFLAASDGFLRVEDKKIIMSTNLHLNQIDDALLRPGRCYAHREFRALTQSESVVLGGKLNPEMDWENILVKPNYTLAEIYDAMDQNTARFITGNETVGFKT